MTGDLEFDAVVIGAGVSGLAAAAKLAREGIRTLLVERNSFPGGRCGLRLINDCYFEIGALYLGSRAVELLQDEFGQSLQVRPAWVGVRWKERWVTLPPGRQMLIDLLRCGVSPFEIGLFCLNLGRLFGERIFNDSANVAQVVHSLSVNPVIREVLLSGLGVSGVSPNHLPAHDLQMGRRARGTLVGNPLTVEGGNGELAHRLLDTFIQAGGKVWFDQTVGCIQPQNGSWSVSVGSDRILTKVVVSATGLKNTVLQLTKAELWPKSYYDSTLDQVGTLEVVNLFIQFKGTPGLPKQYNVFFLPIDVLTQFRDLEHGKYPFPPMFVLQFSGRRSTNRQTIGATLQFYHPNRDESPEEIKKQVDWVLRKGLELLAEGLSTQVLSYEVFPPSRYEAEFGMRPYVFGVAPLAGAPRFSVTTPCPGLFLAGDSVEPERPSVPQALESGILAARAAGVWLRGGRHGR